MNASSASCESPLHCENINGINARLSCAAICATAGMHRIATLITCKATIAKRRRPAGETIPRSRRNASTNRFSGSRMATAFATIFAESADRRGITQAKALCARAKRQQSKEQPAAPEKCAQRQPDPKYHYGQKLNQRRLRISQYAHTDQQRGEHQKKASRQSEPVQNCKDFSIDLDHCAALPICRFKGMPIEAEFLLSHLIAVAYVQIIHSLMQKLYREPRRQ